MKTIKGQNFFTINAIAGETYCIVYQHGYAVNIINQTDAIITISADEAYADDGVSALCVRLAPQSFLNGFRHHDNKLYITPQESGDISVVTVG